MLLAAANARTLSLPSAAVRSAEKRSFASHDGTALFYRSWPAARSSQRDAVILLHREREHSGRVQHLVDELGLERHAFFAWDARGHGCSPGARGDAPGTGCLIKDLDAFVRHIGSHHGIASDRIHVIALGGSGVLAAAWAHDYAPRIASLILAAAAFECRGLASLAPNGLRALQRRCDALSIRTYARAEDLTRDFVRRATYRNDPLIGTHTSARLLIGLRDTAQRVLAAAGSIAAPTQVLVAGEDRLVRREPQLAFFERLGSRDKEIHVFDGFGHDLLGEPERQQVLDQVKRFIRRHTDRWSSNDPAAGHIDAEAARPLVDSRADLPLLEKLRVSASRTGLRTAGRISTGIRLAMEGGLESPELVDHIVRNRAEGASRLGSLIDRRFLDSLPARCLRVRSHHLQRAIAAAAARLRATRLPVRIVDVCAGTGTIVLDAIQALPALPESVLLCDARLEAVACGQRLIRERKLTDIARFRHIEQVNGAWIGSLAPETTIAVAHLHADAAASPLPMEEMLRGLSRALPAGGCLVYASGPHHRGWHSHTAALGRSARDTRTVGTQAELDRCLEAAGFRSLDRWVDEWGVFGVTLCVRAGTEAAVDRFVSR